MKGTPFTQQHTALGARMAAFAGFNMPISYTGINDEHQAVRQQAGLFDVSHMGEFILKGPQALTLIQDLTSNDAAKLTKGKVQYSCMPNDQGGIIDDLLVYCLDENKAYMLVVNAGNIEKDWNWISANNHYGVDMQDISERTALLAVQGPKATTLLQPLTDMDLINLPYYTFVKGTFAGVDNVLISATGYTGAGGVEIYFDADPEKATHIWNAIMQAGVAYGLKPAGLGARDTLRLEMGFCLYGNDIDDHTSPIEAGLGWITKFTKPFKSRDTFEQQKANGTARKLVGFELIERGIARHDHVITDESGAPIGKVTSGTQSPTLSKAIGMGYVRTDLAVPGQIIYINIREQLVKARIVKTPFI